MATTENYIGSNCSGTDGTVNRVLTLSNTKTTIEDGFEVFVNGLFLHPTVDYTVSNLDASSTITFLNIIWNDMKISVTYLTSGAGAGTPGASGILPLNARFIIKELETFGSTVTVRDVTDTSYSDYGDATETTSDVSAVAMVQILDQSADLIREGIFHSGDKIFWFKSTEENIERGNRIYHQSNWYEIVETIEHETNDLIYIREARTKKV